MNCVLITWKPEKGRFSEKDFDQLKKTLRANNGSVEDTWPIRAKDMEAGIPLALFRQGRKTGLIGFGTVLDGQPTEDLGATRRYKVVFRNLRDSIDRPFFDKKLLIKAGIPNSILNTESSGNGKLPDSVVKILDALCQEHYSVTLNEACSRYCMR